MLSENPNRYFLRLSDAYPYLKRIAAVIGLGHHLPLGVRYHVTRKAVAGLQANFRIN